MDKIRWGLLSTARINRRLIPAIRASQRGELVAVASRRQETADAYAAEWGIPKTFGSYEAMLASSQVDAVYVSVPNHLHAEWSIKALQAGKHVLCEKPAAITLEEMDAMIATSRESGCYLSEGFMYRHHPQTKTAGEIVRSGRLGELRALRAVFTFAIASPDDVRLVPEWGGGALWDIGVYPVSLAQFLLGGPPQSVAGFQWIGESGVDEVFTGEMRYPGGKLAQVACSFQVPYYTLAEVLGSQGRLVFNRPFTGMEEDRHLVFYPEDGEPEEIPVPEKELYLGEVEDLHAAVLDGARPYIRLEESRDHIRTVLALYESARTGRVVDLA